MDREIKEIVLATRDFKLTIESSNHSQKILCGIRTELEKHNTTDVVLKVDLGSKVYYLNHFEYGKIIFKGE